MASSGTCMACIRVHGAWQLVVATVVLLQFTSIGSACGEHDHRDAVALNKVISTQLHSSKRSQPQEAPARVSPRLQRPYLGSWEYSGCGNKPCPGGTTLDITPNPWTVKDYVVETQDGPRPWQTLIFTAGSNLTQAAEVHASIYQQTNESLPVLWEWNAWRTLPSSNPSGFVDPEVLDASLHNFSIVYDALVEEFPQLPPSPFGIALGDEPPWELVHSRLADSAAAVKRRYPTAVTHINLEYVTITNASVPPILGAARGLDWLGSDLYYNDNVATPRINASVPAFRAMYERAVYPHLRPDQKIVLVPFAHYCEFYCPIGALPLDHADAYTLQVAEHYTDWADSDERVVALLVYTLKMVWVPEGADVCENPAYTIGSGILTATPWDTTWAGNGIGLTDTCAQDAQVGVHSCFQPLPPSPLGHLRSEWLLGEDGTIVLAAAPAGAPMCLGHFIPPRPCDSPGHRTYRVVNGTNIPTCDNFLGQLQDTSGLSVGACNATRAVLQRQQWSCLDSTNCAGASRIQAIGEYVGCERLPNYRRPPAGVPTTCCLTYVSAAGEPGTLGLNQCGNMPGENFSHYAAQHFQFVPVGGGGGGGPKRFAIQLAASVAQKQCVGAAEPGHALPKTLQLYQQWSLQVKG